MKIQAVIRVLSAVLLFGSHSDGFAPRATRSNSRAHQRTFLRSTVSETSEMMKDIRKQLEMDEDANLMIQALRGQGMNDDDTALEGLDMKLVDVDSESLLPYDYDPAALKAFFSKRPLTVFTRILQVVSVAGGVIFNAILDTLLNRMTPDLEVQRAGELRDIITSLGPFYIKLGQALSIRPDVLSPRSMVELQKLCDKVPSYDSKIAFATIERELGKTVDELFSEITPEPVAAASLGQVYKATLRSTGETVAVKVSRLDRRLDSEVPFSDTHTRCCRCKDQVCWKLFHSTCTWRENLG